MLLNVMPYAKVGVVFIFLQYCSLFPPRVMEILNFMFLIALQFNFCHIRKKMCIGVFDYFSNRI